MKQTTPGLLEGYLKIMEAANKSNDGNRCMIAPSPELKKQLKEDLKKIKKQFGASVLSNILKPEGKTKVGLNDALLRPGNSFPLGMSASKVKSIAANRAPLQGTLRVIVVLVDFLINNSPIQKNNTRICSFLRAYYQQVVLRNITKK